MSDVIDLKPAQERKPRRWLRRLGFAFLLLLVLVWFLPTIAAKSGLLNTAVAKATGNLNGKVSIGNASLGWFSPVVLNDVKLTDVNGKTILLAPTVRSSKSILNLAKNQKDLGTFTIENPQLEIICEKNTTNLEQALAKYLDDQSPAGDRPKVNIVIQNGEATIRDADRNLTWMLKKLDVTVAVPSEKTEAITANVKGNIDDALAGTLEADVSLGSTVAVKAKTTQFPLELVSAFGRRFEPGLATAGRLTADVDASIANAGTINAKVTSTITATDLEVGSERFGTERLKLKQLNLPCVVETTSAGVRIEKADLLCDVGTASFAGVFDPNEPLEKWIERAGLSAKADVDIAKVAAMFPKLLRLKEGTALQEGRLVANLTSRAGANGTTWDGTVNTSAVRGTREGKPLAWDQPVNLSFAGRLTPERLPVFERLDAKADFATLTGSGSMENFTLNGNVSLDTLTRRLSDFVDLSGMQFGGTAKLNIAAKTTTGVTNFTGTANVDNLDYFDGTRRVREPALNVAFNVDGKFLNTPVMSVTAGTAKVTAGAETAELKLLEPIADLKQLNNGKAAATLTGDLERWIARSSSFVSLPVDLKLGGVGTLGGNVKFDAEQFTMDNVTANLKNAKFHGYGLKVDEEQLFIQPTNGTFHRKSGLMEFPKLVVQAPTIAAVLTPMKIIPQRDGSYGLEIEGFANANLSRVQTLLQLQTDPKLSDRLDGMVMGGKIRLTSDGTTYNFDANLPVQKFVLGPPQKPTWTEEKVSIVGKGSYDLAQDNLAFERAILERPDGLKADLSGRINKATTVSDLDVSGKLTYDLAQLEPQLKKFLGNSFKVVGKDTRDFSVKGRLSAGVEGLAVNVAPQKQASPFGELNGNASLAWQSLKAYGFDVGQSQLSAKLDKGIMTIDPLEAAFGETGKVRLEPTVKFLPTGNEVTLASGKIVNQAKLTPAACADALGYVLPPLAKASQAQGTISFDLDDNRIPLSDPLKASMKGKLTLHSVQISPGPVITEIATLLGAQSTTFNMNREQVVPVKFENGWVHHEKFTITGKNFEISTRGAVSVNGEMNIVADVPLPDDAIGPLLKNNPKLREALAGKRIQVPIKGTINKPQLDPGAFRTAVRQVAQEMTRDAAKGAIGGFLEKLGPQPPKK